MLGVRRSERVPTVSRTGTVGMYAGNHQKGRAGPAGRRRDLIFDLLKLAEVEVRLDEYYEGLAVGRQDQMTRIDARSPRPSRLSRRGPNTSV